MEIIFKSEDTVILRLTWKYLRSGYFSKLFLNLWEQGYDHKSFYFSLEDKKIYFIMEKENEMEMVFFRL